MALSHVSQSQGTIPFQVPLEIPKNHTRMPSISDKHQRRKELGNDASSSTQRTHRLSILICHTLSGSFLGLYHTNRTWRMRMKSAVRSLVRGLELSSSSTFSAASSALVARRPPPDSDACVASSWRPRCEMFLCNTPTSEAGHWQIHRPPER